MILLLLFIASVFDIKKRIIPDTIHILIIIYGILSKIFYLMPSILTFSVLIIIVPIIEKKQDKLIIGGGDIKLISALIFVLGYNIVPVFSYTLIPQLITLIIQKLQKKQEYIPFAPYVLIGYFLYLL